MSSLDANITELYKSHQASQQKYTYFVLAAAGASIGFAVQKTEGLPLSWWLVPAALAVAAWGASFYFGCKVIDWTQSVLFANYAMLQLKQGSHPQQPRPHEAPYALEGVQEALEGNRQKANTFYIWQFRMLLWGAVFFIAWRVVEAYRLTVGA